MTVTKGERDHTAGSKFVGQRQICIRLSMCLVLEPRRVFEWNALLTAAVNVNKVQAKNLENNKEENKANKVHYCRC